MTVSGHYMLVSAQLSVAAETGFAARGETMPTELSLGQPSATRAISRWPGAAGRQSAWYEMYSATGETTT
jgi:hypothetical protein